MYTERERNLFRIRSAKKRLNGLLSYVNLCEYTSITLPISKEAILSELRADVEKGTVDPMAAQSITRSNRRYQGSVTDEGFHLIRLMRLQEKKVHLAKAKGLFVDQNRGFSILLKVQCHTLHLFLLTALFLATCGSTLIISLRTADIGNVSRVHPMVLPVSLLLVFLIYFIILRDQVRNLTEYLKSDFQRYTAVSVLIE